MWQWFGVRLVGLALVAAFIALRVWDPPPLEILRQKTFDVFQMIQPRTISSDAVVVIDVDETSLRELGQWPWPRTMVADLISQLAAAAPAAIAFDVLFAEPDRLSPTQLVKTHRALDEETKAGLRKLADNETFLAEAMGRTKVVLGQAGNHTPLKSTYLRDLPRTAFAMIGDPKPFLLQFPGLIHNVPILENAAAGRGLFTLRADRDGIFRRVPAVMIAENVLVPALAIELLRVATGSGAILVKTDQAGVKSVVVGGRELATDRNSQLWLHYRAFDRNRFVSASDVIAGRIGRERLQGKIVLIGTSAAGLYDLRATPIDGVRPGVDIHAELIDSVLTGSLLQRPNYALGAEVSLAAAVGLAMIALVPALGAVPSLLTGAAIALGLGYMSWFMFVQHGILLDVVYPMVSNFAVFSALVFTNYMREEARRSQIRNAFAQYLSPDLVAQLTRSPDRLVLGGETRELTILFSDVRGFTSIAEGYKEDPAGLTDLMNRLLSPLSDAILERRGTIDKYMGDAIMAFWNAPLDDDNHAANACRAALNMIEKLSVLNQAQEVRARAQNLPHVPLRLGIGLSTGLGIVGNMGSDVRFDYTVLGDHVNLASRLEHLTRTYDLPILLADETARRGASGLACLEVDRVIVRGRTEPETIHTLLGAEEIAADPRFVALRQGCEGFLAAYRAADWPAALDHLEQLRSEFHLFGLEPLMAIYQARVHQYAATPPSPDWAGVHRADAT